MTWLNAILEVLKELFGMGKQISENKGQKIPYQIEGIEAGSKLKAKKKQIRIDKVEDRWIRKEPKEILEFNSFLEYEKWSGDYLYMGRKADVLFDVKKDYGNVLTFQQQQEFKRHIQKSEAEFFIITLHPKITSKVSLQNSP